MRGLSEIESTQGSRSGRQIGRHDTPRDPAPVLVLAKVLAKVLVVVLAMAPALAGCAISNSLSESSGSVSDSVSESSESISDSSGSSSGGDDQAYRDEVRDYVALAALRDASPDTMRRGVSEIALGFGISDWEAVPATWVAIERGLGALPASTRQSYRQALARAPSGGREPTTDLR